MGSQLLGRHSILFCYSGLNMFLKTFLARLTNVMSAALIRLSTSFSDVPLLESRLSNYGKWLTFSNGAVFEMAILKSGGS